MHPPDQADWIALAVTALIGAAVGLGKTLLKEDWSASYIIGNILAHMILAMAAGALLIWIPDLPFLALVGAAAGLASLGVVMFQLLIRKRLGVEEIDDHESGIQRSRPRDYDHDQDWWE